MKKILILVLVFSLSSTYTIAQTDNNDSGEQSMFFTGDSLAVNSYGIVQADSAYIQGDYTTAAAIYEKVLESQGVSSALYMNLGNAYFKLDEIAKAILNYERAYQLDPSDNDIRFNLEFARSRIVDKETNVNELFIVTWMKYLAALMNVEQWAIMTIVLFAMLVLSVGLYLFNNKVAVKKVSFGMAAALLVLSIMSFCFASSQKNSLVKSDSAIIMSPSVTVKSTPNDNGTELFIIHEGRKVRVLDNTMKDWVEIRLNDGNEGWIPVSSLEII